MSKHSVMIARFPYQNQECPDTTDWLVQTVLKMKADPRVGEVLHVRKDDTPVTMTRNAVAAAALGSGSDYLLLIDSDMKPDCEPDGKPFWDTSWEWILKERGQPVMIAAPYGGPPPCENVYIFQWANYRNDAANPDFRLEQYSREQAGLMQGIGEVAALPTGLMLIDCRIFQRLDPPWFYYEWTDKRECQKGSTEDVTFTRDASLQGFKTYCNWDAWAGHWKRHLVRKPRPLTVDAIRDKFVKAVRHNIKSGDRMIEINQPRPPRSPCRSVAETPASAAAGEQKKPGLVEVLNGGNGAAAEANRD